MHPFSGAAYTSHSLESHLGSLERRPCTGHCPLGPDTGQSSFWREFSQPQEPIPNIVTQTQESGFRSSRQGTRDSIWALCPIHAPTRVTGCDREGVSLGQSLQSPRPQSAGLRRDAPGTGALPSLPPPPHTACPSLPLLRFSGVGLIEPDPWKLLKAKRAVRESVPRQVDRESRGPQGERGLEFSRTSFFSFSTFLRII